RSQRHSAPPALQSSPTRRSSDLISALAMAAIATRWLLPALMDPVPARDAANSHALAALWHRISKLPRPRIALGMLALAAAAVVRSEEHTSELQSRENLVCRLLPE